MTVKTARTTAGAVEIMQSAESKLPSQGKNSQADKRTKRRKVRLRKKRTSISPAAMPSG